MSLLTLAFIMFILFIPSPMALNISIIVLSILVSLNFNIVAFSWFSFIVFLLYVGGMLVIFMYFSSLTPNQKFPFTPLMITAMSTVLVLSNFNNYNMFSSTSPLKNEPMLMFSLFNTPMTILFILFLFVMLLVVVKLSSNYKLPMRPMK